MCGAEMGKGWGVGNIAGSVRGDGARGRVWTEDVVAACGG